MQLDFWRAMGVTYGAAFIYALIGIVIYNPQIPLSTSDIWMTVLVVPVTILFAYVYFASAGAPSAQHGLVLGAVMLIAPYLLGMLFGIGAAAQGQPLSVLPPVSNTLLVIAVLITLASSSAVGWYLDPSRNKAKK